MNAHRILHVMPNDKFIGPFIDFVEQNFLEYEQHLFFILGQDTTYPVQRRKNILLSSDFKKPRNAYLKLAALLNQTDRIILHGLFNAKVIQLLALQPWLLKKCYWVIWGGDLYRYRLGERSMNWQKQEIFRRFVIKRLGHLITYIKGDIELAREWYGATGKYHECLMYPSNLFKGHTLPTKEEATINILMGNSADPSNEHLEIIEKLKPYANEDIRIFAPLSYSDDNNSERVARVGKETFGGKFIPLMKFISHDDYLELLGKIDIAIFNHRRQQGMGTTITLLGLGKKVFMRSDITPWRHFSELGIKLYDTDQFDFDLIEKNVSLSNRKKVSQHFHEEKLRQQLDTLFQ